MHGLGRRQHLFVDFVERALDFRLLVGKLEIHHLAAHHQPYADAVGTLAELLHGSVQRIDGWIVVLGLPAVQHRVDVYGFQHVEDGFGLIGGRFLDLRALGIDVPCEYRHQRQQQREGGGNQDGVREVQARGAVAHGPLQGKTGFVSRRILPVLW